MIQFLRKRTPSPNNFEIAEKLDRDIIPVINQFISSKTPQKLTDSNVINWNIRDGYNGVVSLSGNRILNITGLEEGDYGTLIIKQDSTGSRTLTLPPGSVVGSGGGGLLSLSTSPLSKDIATFFYESGVLNWTISTNFN